MATIQKLSDKKGKTRFRVMVRVAGHPARYATFGKRADAAAWAADIEGDMRMNRYISDATARKYTAADMIDRYIENVLPVKSQKPRYIEGQRHQLMWWRSFIGKHLLINVTVFVLSDARDKLQQRGLKPATINRYLAALHHVFNVAKNEWGWVQLNPVSQVRKPKEPKGRVRFLSGDELLRLLHACRKQKRQRLYQIVMLALSTGARKGELLTIKLKDVDLERGCITIHDTKNHESRRLAITSNMADILQPMLRSAGKEQVYLFQNPRTNKPYALDDAWHKVRCAAEIEDFHFHDLRHTFASYMAMNGASLAVIAEALGHKTLNMVKRYAHLSETHTSSVINEMAEKFIFSQKIAPPAEAQDL